MTILSTRITYSHAGLSDDEATAALSLLMDYYSGLTELLGAPPMVENFVDGTRTYLEINGMEMKP